MEPNSSIFYVRCPLGHFLPHINHLSVSPTNGPTQGQRKTLTRSGKCNFVENETTYFTGHCFLLSPIWLWKHGKKSSIAFIKYFSKIIQQMKKNAGFLLLD